MCVKCIMRNLSHSVLVFRVGKDKIISINYIYKMAKNFYIS